MSPGPAHSHACANDRREYVWETPVCVEGDQGPHACSRASSGNVRCCRAFAQALEKCPSSNIPRAVTSCKSDESEDELAPPHGDGVDDEDVEVDSFERSVNEEVRRFQKEPLKKKDCSLNTQAQVWHERGWKHFTHVRYVAQQVIGSHSPRRLSESLARRVGFFRVAGVAWTDTGLRYSSSSNPTSRGSHMKSHRFVEKHVKASAEELTA